LKKRFVSKKNINVDYKGWLFKIVVTITIVFLLIKLIGFLAKSNFSNNKYIYDMTVSNSLLLLVDGYDSYNKFINLDLRDPRKLLKYSMNSILSDEMLVFEETDNYDERDAITEYFPDPNPINVELPLVYVFNTHQLEAYDSQNLSEYNIKPNVLMVSYYLKEKLNANGLPTIVEDNDISEVLRVNNWKYSYSYKASRILLEDAYKKNSSLKFFIDIHRDSASYDKTTTIIDNKPYARVLFVVGKKHKNYEHNLTVANELNELIKKFNPNLSRGISIKDGEGVNGIYNQDFSSNLILLEIGGQYNSINEATNTIDVMAEVLKNYIKEKT